MSPPFHSAVDALYNVAANIKPNFMSPELFAFSIAAGTAAGIVKTIQVAADYFTPKLANTVMPFCETACITGLVTYPLVGELAEPGMIKAAMQDPPTYVSGFLGIATPRIPMAWMDVKQRWFSSKPLEDVVA